MAYTTLAQGSSVTVTITDQFDGLEVINRSQDLAQVALATGTWSYGATPQQHSGRRVYQLNGAGSITLTATSGSLQYELTDAADNRVAQSLSVAETASIRALVSGAWTPITVEHLPSTTTLAATTTPATYVSRFGYATQASIAVTQAGGSSVAGDIQIAYSNDAGVTLGSYTTIGTITAGGTTTINVPTLTMPGAQFRVRLANVTGTLSGATVGINVSLS